MNEDNGNGKWIDADEALEVGLIDEIMEPTRAAASVSKEFLDKYKLPQIPDSLMSKINLIPVETGDAVPTGKTHSFLSGILTSIKEFMKTDPLVDNVDDEKAKAEKLAAEKAEAEKIEAEKLAAEKAEAERIEKEKEAAKANPDPVKELADLKAEIKSLREELIAGLEADNAKLKAELGDARTKLAQATAKSTIVTGPTGKEGDNEKEDEVKAETRKTLNALNNAINGTPLDKK
jgi:hypothetical protein